METTNRTALTTETAPESIDLLGDGKYIGTKVVRSGKVAYEVAGPKATFFLMPYQNSGGTSADTFYLIRRNGNIATLRGNGSFRVRPDGRVSCW